MQRPRLSRPALRRGQPRTTELIRAPTPPLSTPPSTLGKNSAGGVLTISHVALFPAWTPGRPHPGACFPSLTLVLLLGRGLCFLPAPGPLTARASAALAALGSGVHPGWRGVWGPGVLSQAQWPDPNESGVAGVPRREDAHLGPAPRAGAERFLTLSSVGLARGTETTGRSSLMCMGQPDLDSLLFRKSCRQRRGSGGEDRGVVAASLCVPPPAACVPACCRFCGSST